MVLLLPRPTPQAFRTLRRGPCLLSVILLFSSVLLEPLRVSLN